MRFAFFDLDDTLVDTATALRAWSDDFVAEYGLAENGDTAASVFQDRVRGVNTWKEFAENAEDWYGITTPAQELLERIAEAYPKKFTLDPAVADGLTRLREAGWRLGIITNGTTIVQQAKIDQAGLRTYVDVAIDSESAGFDKPDLRIFEIAADQLGVDLGPHGWMVGDMLNKDIEGGLAAGLRTIWLPLGRPLPQVGPRPERTAASILDAIELVAGSGK